MKPTRSIQATLLAAILCLAPILTVYCHDFGRVVTICSHEGLSSVFIPGNTGDDERRRLDDHPCCVAGAVDLGLSADRTKPARATADSIHHYPLVHRTKGWALYQAPQIRAPPAARQS